MVTFIPVKIVPFNNENHTYAFEQVDLLRQRKGKNAARGLPTTKTLDVLTFPDSIDVESDISNSKTLIEAHQPSVLSSVMDAAR